MADGQNAQSALATLDEVLLDVAAIIELSLRDRRVAENRYRLLKTHLERGLSALSPLLVDGESRIYAQGSIAASTTIVSGLDDDRFDVDAIVEIDVPPNWTDADPLDLLEESLQGFPGVVKIVRCTRCVQLQFPFMHMDVTILDRRQKLAIERAGEIFHSPDEGGAYRVASNPWGFTKWFRGVLVPNQTPFEMQIRKHRATASRSRLQPLDENERMIVAKADQDPLPPAIPSHVDAQEAVALKLLKRFLNLYYEAKTTLKRPPSIYLTKITGAYGYEPRGLATQLYGLAASLAATLQAHIDEGTRPLEENPAYPADKINDRWPRAGTDGVTDMKMLVKALGALTAALEEMVGAPLDKIIDAIEQLFGERVAQEERRVLKERYQRATGDSALMVEPKSGQVYSPAIVRSREGLREIPRHNFHPMRLKKKEE